MSTEQNDFQGGHTPLTPPPASGAPAPGAPAPGGPASGAAPQTSPPPPSSYPPASGTPGGGRGSGATAITVVVAVVGGIALLGSGGTAAVAAMGDLSRTDSAQTIAVDGITELDLDVSASNVRVEFGDVDEAELVVTSGRGRAWTLQRDEDELVVRSPDRGFGWWFGNWFGDEETAVLTLPEELRGAGLDADLTLNAGSLDVDGDFGELGIEVNAGAADVEGSATSLDAEMSAGRADILLDGVREAELGVSAGQLVVELTGTAPTETSIDVSAGSARLTVPDAEYRIVQDVSAGSLDSTLDQTADAAHIIDVRLSAGSVTLRPGG